MHFLNATIPLCSREQHPISKNTRLTIIFLIAGFLQVNAAGYAQKVSISGDNLPLKAIFKSIEKQTDFVFMYDETVLDDTKTVSVHMTDAAVTDLLDKCLRNQPVLYSITGKTIFIKRKLPNLDADISVRQTEKHKIVGVVKGENGIPLEGASVLVVQLKRNVLTNKLGEFVFQGVPDGRFNVEISYVGYETYQTVIVVEKVDAFFNAFMKQNVNSLDETVVKGYYTTTKRLNTGNVAIVKGEEIRNQPVTDPIMALEGRVTGLYIKQANGIPGSSILGGNSFTLRGSNSLRTNGNAPLFVVDGIPFGSTSLTSSILGGGAAFLSPFNSINPDDIESIEILKDADATAIYGSRGANGVILINTKKGKTTSTKFQLNIASGSGDIARKIKLLNTPQYLAMRREAFSNDGKTPGPNDYDINGTWDTTRSTDWQKEFIGGTARLNKVTFAITGGGSNTQFSISGAFSNQTTVFPGDYHDKIVNSHFSLNHNSVDNRFNLGVTAYYAKDLNQIPTLDFTKYIMTLPPDAPALFDNSGKLNWEKNSHGIYTFNNPLSSTNQKSKSTTANLISNFTLSYEILPGLKLYNSFGYNKIQMNQNIITPITTYSPANANYPNLRTNNLATNQIESWIDEPQLLYKRAFGKATVDVIFGATFQENRQNSFVEYTSNYSSDELINNIAAASTISIPNYNAVQYKYNAFFGKASLNWNSTYIINVTARRDGSTKFGPGYQFGNFGSLGAAWIFSKLRLFQPLNNIVSNGKLRASYGITGNDQISDYQYLSSYSSYNFPYQGTAGLFPTRLFNPNYRWEQVRKFEMAMELSLFKDKFNINISYYKNHTDNQLVNYALPTLTGFGTITANLPALIQNSGYELEISSTNIKNEHLVWTSSFNISALKNKLVKYPNIEGSPYANLYTVGNSLYSTKAFIYSSVDPSTGLYTFKDVNKDNQITYPDDFRAGPAITQQYFGALSNSIRYRELSVEFLIQFVKQRGRDYFSYFNRPGTMANQPVYVLDRWQKPGDISDIQKFSQNSFPATIAFSNARSSDYFIRDASYIRLKNVSLSYSLTNLCSNNFLKNSRLYLQAQNLLTITGYRGLDPDNNGGLALPPLRMLLAGAQIVF